MELHLSPYKNWCILSKVFLGPFFFFKEFVKNINYAQNHVHQISINMFLKYIYIMQKNIVSTPYFQISFFLIIFFCNDRTERHLGALKFLRTIFNTFSLFISPHSTLIQNTKRSNEQVSRQLILTKGQRHANRTAHISCFFTGAPKPCRVKNIDILRINKIKK